MSFAGDRSRRRKLFAGFSHVARYAVGAGLSWLIFPLEAALVYLMGLIAAILFNQDLGGPLAAPMMILLAMGLGVVVTALVTLPAALLGELIARKTHWIAAPAAAVGSAMILLTAYVWGWGIAVRSAASQTAVIWAVIVALSLLPLLTFLVVTYSSGAVVALITAAVARRNQVPQRQLPKTLA
jgi:hypothetical protein